MDLREIGSEARIISKHIALLILLGLIGVILFAGCSKIVVSDTAESYEQNQIAKIVQKSADNKNLAFFYSQVPTTERKVSIVFEGYLDEAIMMELADMAGERNLEVVFFISGADASEHPAVVKYLTDAGCAIGNYGLSGQSSMEKNSLEKNARQFYKTSAIIKTACGIAPSLLRCNNTEYTDEILSLAYLTGHEGVVEPSSFLNHSSFVEEANSLNFVRKLTRGSIISIKLGQELSEDEFKDSLHNDEHPADDPNPSLNLDSSEAEETTAHGDILQVFSWLLEALEQEEYEIVSLKQLETARMTFADEPKAIAPEILAKLDISLYPNLTTESPFGAEESAAVEDSYFNDAVFVGDSVTAKLEDYVTEKRKTNPGFFGQAQFLASKGMSVGNSLWKISNESRHPTYNGQRVLIEDGVRMSGAKKVYIMLGVNDIQFYDLETYLENYQKLIYLIKTETPDAEIFIESITPGTEDWTRSPSNEEIFAYDLALVKFCLEYGYTYIDVAYKMRDGSGNLISSYCSDPDGMEFHFTFDACQIWLDYLYTHTN